MSSTDHPEPTPNGIPGPSQENSSNPQNLDRALRLLDFLIKVQQQKTKPVRDYNTYSNSGGDVLFLDEIPQHEAIECAHRAGEPEVGDPLLILNRVPKTDPPTPPDTLRSWIRIESLTDPNQEPILKDRIVEKGQTEDGQPYTTTRDLADHPKVPLVFEEWLPSWKSWAAKELEDRPARELYRQVFKLSELFSGAPEELELLTGVGCLSWDPEDHDPVRRHTLVVSTDIQFDSQTGQIIVMVAEEAPELRPELDLLDPTHWPDQSRLQAVKELLDEQASHPLNRELVGLILQRLAYSLSSDGTYFDEDVPRPITSDPGVAFAPALILRKRSSQSLLAVFEQIKEQISETKEVPPGVARLVSASEHRGPTVPGPGWGPEADESLYLPLPANQEQVRVVGHVDTHAQTVVRGPPGTGKTHTIANLLSHLLAKGSRVLITAQTDRALRELQGKLPDALSQLLVSVVGRERADLADLKVAVETIAAKASDFDGGESEDRIESLRQKLGSLRRERSELSTQLMEVREREVTSFQWGSYAGTLAEIAKRHRDEAETFSWLEGFRPYPSDEPPLTDEEALKWLSLLRDPNIVADEAEAGKRMPQVDGIPNPDDFADLADRERRAADLAREGREWQTHEAFEAVSRLKPEVREELRERSKKLADVAARLSSRQEAWMSDALHAICSNRSDLWVQRFEEIRRRLDQAKPKIDSAGATTTVVVPSTGGARFRAQAEGLRAHLEQGGRIRSFLAPKPVRMAREFLEKVLVNDAPPDTAESIVAFSLWLDLDQLEKLWPKDVHVPPEDTLLERWAWNDTECHQLSLVIQLGEELREEEARLETLGVPCPDWTNLDEVSAFGATVEAATAAELAQKAQVPLLELEEALSQETRWPDAAPVSQELHTSVTARDPVSYRRAFNRLTALWDVREKAKERDELEEAVEDVTEGLVSKVKEEHQDQEWESRLSAFEAAWSWIQAGAWIDEMAASDVDTLQQEINATGQRIRKTLTALTAELAWSKAVGRLGVREQQSLKSYALAVRQLGKGKGKYAPHKRAIARDALRECRSAVPAWVMPIYRLAETLDVGCNIFDVIIIDEASQAGLEAAFLHYLAETVVVVGDDKQVSPSGVGIQRQQLIDLRRQFLFDFEASFIWENPETSFFDLAQIRSPDEVITLREHFRCVPEIIGFSNRIAYEPDRVPLIPLRQYGKNRLEPIKTIHVRDGYTRGRSGSLINLPEAERVVEQVMECCEDPAYAGKTLGVISLTGRAQAEAIERLLLEQMDPTEFKARDIRCGDAAAFQGSERDVIFLSMVAVREPERALPALTHDRYLQRFNVAASRAKDQLWLFHSVSLNELHNQEDMRFQLLDYCLGVMRRTREETEETHGRVPDDVLIDPFDSLFEQHVYNRLVDRGYTVVPQWEIHGKRIDLVVVGGQNRMAVECDGDRWHGADKYEEDMARQRELERCGWTFFRIRASAFYRDPLAALEPLWPLLGELEIHPAHWVAEEEPKEAEKRTVILTPGIQPASVAADQSQSKTLSIQSVSEPILREPGPSQGYSVDQEGRRPQTSEFTGNLFEPEDSTHVAREQPGHDERQEPQDEFERERASTKPSRGAGLHLEPYPAWDTEIQLPDIATASYQDRIEALVEIVAIEGPVLGHRLYQLYVKSAGGKRVGRQIASLLNRASNGAETRKLLVGDNPLHETGQKAKTFRLPGQPEVAVRELGPRSLHEVPPAELAAVIRAMDGDLDEEEMFRGVLDIYGLKRLTGPVRDTLREARRVLVNRSVPDEDAGTNEKHTAP